MTCRERLGEPSVEVPTGGVTERTKLLPRRVSRRVRVDGAKRGPAPAHPVGIWAGAYKPRFLRLVGWVAEDATYGAVTRPQAVIARTPRVGSGR